MTKNFKLRNEDVIITNDFKEMFDLYHGNCNETKMLINAMKSIVEKCKKYILIMFEDSFIIIKNSNKVTLFEIENDCKIIELADYNTFDDMCFLCEFTNEMIFFLKNMLTK